MNQLNSLNVEQLKALAKKNHCFGYSKLRKTELIQHILNCERGQKKVVPQVVVNVVPQRVVQPVSDLSRMTKENLQDIARKLGCKGYSKLSKMELVSFIKNCQSKNVVPFREPIKTYREPRQPQIRQPFREPIGQNLGLIPAVLRKQKNILRPAFPKLQSELRQQIKEKIEQIEEDKIKKKFREMLRDLENAKRKLKNTPTSDSKKREELSEELDDIESQLSLAIKDTRKMIEGTENMIKDTKLMLSETKDDSGRILNDCLPEELKISLFEYEKILNMVKNGSLNRLNNQELVQLKENAKVLYNNNDLNLVQLIEIFESNNKKECSELIKLLKSAIDKSNVMLVSVLEIFSYRHIEVEELLRRKEGLKKVPSYLQKRTFQEKKCSEINNLNECVSVVDENNLRRCRVNMKTKDCEFLPLNLRERATLQVGGSAQVKVLQRLETKSSDDCIIEDLKFSINEFEDISNDVLNNTWFFELNNKDMKEFRENLVIVYNDNNSKLNELEDNKDCRDVARAMKIKLDKLFDKTLRYIDRVLVGKEVFSGLETFSPYRKSKRRVRNKKN